MGSVGFLGRCMECSSWIKVGGFDEEDEVGKEARLIHLIHMNRAPLEIPTIIIIINKFQQ